MIGSNKWNSALHQRFKRLELDYLKAYDKWLKGVFRHIHITNDEHAIHNFALPTAQRLSSVVFKHSVAAFYAGQTDGKNDCKAALSGRVKKMADDVLPGIGWEEMMSETFTPTEAIAELKKRSIKLAGGVEVDIVQAVKKILLDHLAGVPRKETEEKIAKLLDENKSRASLIVTTETTYAYNRGRVMQYKQSNVDYVRFTAVMDARTSTICRSRDGLVMAMDDPELANNTPPLHGRCRSVLTPIYSRYEPHLITEQNTDWSKVAPLPKGWIAA